MKENQNKQEISMEIKSNSNETIQPVKVNPKENEEKIKKPAPKPEHANRKKEVELPEKDHEHEFSDPLGSSNNSDQNGNIKKEATPPLPKEANQKISGGQKDQYTNSNPVAK